MDNLYFTIIGGIISLASITIGALLNHFLSKNRYKQERLLDKKIEIYTDILVKINSLLQDEEPLLKNLDFFADHKARIILIKCLSRGRLIAGRKLEIKLRDYYEIASEWWSKKDDESQEYKELSNKMDNLVIEIEQLMRKEIGNKKLY